MATLASHGYSAMETAARIMFLVMTLESACVHASFPGGKIEQKFQIYQAFMRCSAIIANVTKPADGDVYCEPVWDNVMCWPDYVKAGENVSQSCPTYIHLFNPFENATRSCTEDGTWKKHPDDRINKTWTDFNNCFKEHRSTVPAVIEEHMPIVIRISTIGYFISLGTLIIATAIMIFFRKLHCHRNTIHVNLFMSFIFRAIICLLRNTLLVRHLALPSDIRHTDDGTLVFIEEGMHWECKLLNTLWQYSLNANYMWIFVEGLYLHTLIFFAVFSQSRRIFKLYIIIGWVFPLVFILVWVITRIFKNNTLCWNTHDKGYYWILNAPIISSISINFFFFLNIMRVLFTKIRDCHNGDSMRYRKLAKSTLVLIPLFGVYYIFFILLSMNEDPKISVIHMYMEMTLNSFQGTVVALLFCFLNGEVRSEITKKWHRHWLRKHSVGSGRSSRAFSTISFYTGKDRASLSHAPPQGDTASKEDHPNNSSHNNNNGRPFHKVSSMPKLSVGCCQYTKPITRVSSSSKVTFNTCFEIDDALVSDSRETTQKSDIKSLSKGSLEFSQTKCFILEGNKVVNRDTNEPLPTKTHSPGVNTQSFKFKPRNEVSNPTQIQVPSLNGLPPLVDEEEDVAGSLDT